MKFWLLLIFNLTCFLTQTLGIYNNGTTIKKTNDDDFYPNYDYEVPNNVNTNNNSSGISSGNLEVNKNDLLILPNPEFVDPKYTVDRLPNVDLPDDSLADTDLRDHDFIDNLMYVYYGSHNRNGGSYGSEIIIIGSVLSCAAQLLTIFCAFLKKKSSSRKEIRKMFLHLMGCLCFSNLVFMLGIYATKNAVRCQIVALVLHYLHLLTAFWIFLYCYYIYKCYANQNVIQLRFLFLTAYGLPAALTLASLLIAPHSYETKRFCFVSVQKGMLLNYMLPISILIIVTTVCSLNGIRKINLDLSKLEMTSSAESLNILRNEIDFGEVGRKVDVQNEEIVSLKECKNLLKVLCVVQTSYDVVWFTAVLALENVNYSNSMPIFYSIFSFLLNWYIFLKSRSFLPTIVSANDGTVNVEICAAQDPEKSNSVSTSRRSSCDNIPLLINTDMCTEMLELHQDTISTISS